jgi:hypothetical protein
LLVVVYHSWLDGVGVMSVRALPACNIFAALRTSLCAVAADTRGSYAA